MATDTTITEKPPAEEIRQVLAKLFDVPVPDGFIVVLVGPTETPMIRTDAPHPHHLLNMLARLVHAMTDELANGNFPETIGPEA